MDHEKLKIAFEANKKRIDAGLPRTDVKSVRVLEPNVKEIRNSLGMSQSEFAAAFWLSLNSVRNWEQGVRTPEGPARAYLTVIRYDAKAVIDALNVSVATRIVGDVSVAEQKSSSAVAEDNTVIAEFGQSRVRELTGKIESYSEDEQGLRLAASTSGRASKAKQNAIAQLVDVSGLSFAKILLGKDAMVLIEPRVSGEYNSLHLGGHDFALKARKDGVLKVEGLSLADLLSLTGGGGETASLKIEHR